MRELGKRGKQALWVIGAIVVLMIVLALFSNSSEAAIVTDNGTLTEPPGTWTVNFSQNHTIRPTVVMTVVAFDFDTGGEATITVNGTAIPDVLPTSITANNNIETTFTVMISVEFLQTSNQIVFGWPRDIAAGRTPGSSYQVRSVSIAYEAELTTAPPPIITADNCTPEWCVNSDADTWPDIWDNCTLAPNQSQLDADHDGYGNMCDGDLDQSGLVTAQDYNLFRERLNSNDPVADFNGSGTVTAIDYNLFRNMLNAPPGPSAPSYITVGGTLYSSLVCVGAGCSRPDSNSEVLGVVEAGSDCWLLPPTSFVEPELAQVWGTPVPSAGPGAGYAICHLR